ncbi:hypothetical protein WG66_001627 [Moniliophthora roreri]|nr:hypothetical protein WG66_001627 [Moniliophthora roreri]
MNAGAGSGMSSLSSAPIFDSDRNKFKEFKHLFLGYCELQNVVEGLTQKKLSDDDKKDKDKFAFWNENNNKCMGLFKMKLGPLLQHFIKDTAKLTWDALIAEYDKFNLAEIFEWFSVLTAINIGKGQNPTNAYNLIQTCLIKLKEEQIEIADWMVSMILMKALPGSWDTFKSQVFVTAEKKEDFAVSSNEKKQSTAQIIGSKEETYQLEI